MKVPFLGILLALISTVTRLFGQVSSLSVQVSQFAGDRAAAISYTFDDGLRDQYTLAVPMLNEVGFKGTFFVIPSKVSETIEDAERRKNDKRAWGTITWDELREMARQGHEIGSHTWSHTGLTKQLPEEVDAELSKSYDAIKTRLGQPPLTIAFPFNQSTPEIQAAALKHYVAYRDHQLGVGSPKSTVDWLNKWADQQVRDHKWGVIMAHAIGSGYAAFADPDILRAHLQYVKSHEKDIWVDTFANVARYTKERDNTKVTILSSGSGHVTFTLACALDPGIYNVPLTLVFEKPGATSVHAECAGSALAVQILHGSIQIDVVPSKNPIAVTWK
ncbi:MAG: polysaccharide deacetylase family protein [Chthoniobacteraceae bacterium]